jgi:HD superfamily phosphohydrolase YqeK
MVNAQGLLLARQLLPGVKSWFAEYCHRFDSNDAAIQDSIDLKASHTHRVCDAILDIGKSLCLSDEDLCLAEISALLHDIGRFEQYRQYRTFADSRSLNHASLGAKIIEENSVLNGINSTDANIVIRAVESHNIAELPQGESDRCLLFLKLLRDADKIDIWRVLTEYYRDAASRRNRTIELDLPDADCVSDSVYEALMNGKLVNMSDVRTLQDFKLLQISWIYDLNFPRSFQIVNERKYLEAIQDALPRDSLCVENACERAYAHLKKMLLPHGNGRADYAESPK